MLAGKDWKDFQSCLNRISGPKLNIWRNNTILTTIYEFLTKQYSFSVRNWWNLGGIVILWWWTIILAFLRSFLPLCVPSITEVKQHWAQSVLGWVTAYKRVNPQWLQNSEPLLGLPCLRSVDSGSLGRRWGQATTILTTVTIEQWALIGYCLFILRWFGQFGQMMGTGHFYFDEMRSSFKTWFKISFLRSRNCLNLSNRTSSTAKKGNVK
jgi:hypothetical protein